uniref:Uncharacterized protein n=1 Tax=Globodera pallida TaxID=36090 RepID=A0A183CGJ0_GLOPA
MLAQEITRLLFIWLTSLVSSLRKLFVDSLYPIHLTDGHNGKKIIPFYAVAQCSAFNWDGKSAKTSGLAFRLPQNREGHCDDGLLICYPKTLTRNYFTGIGSASFKVKRTFQVVNKKNNTVTQKCEAFLKKNGITNGNHWRGLAFRLPRNGEGHCDDGLLICYPKTLTRNYFTGIGSASFKVKRTFQVVNKKINTVTQKCEAFLKKNGITNGNHWRGIYVYTKSLNDRKTNPTRQTILETSLTPRVYNFGSNTRQLEINFGFRGNRYTTVTTNEGKSYLTDEFNRTNPYSKHLSDGAYLEEYTGLWLLGMDMLPSMDMNNVTLFVERSCSCTMEAWVTRPTDSIFPMNGSKMCKKNITPEEYERLFPKNVDKYLFATWSSLCGGLGNQIWQKKMQFFIQFFILLVLAVALCSGGGCFGKEASESTKKPKGGDGKKEKSKQQEALNFLNEENDKRRAEKKKNGQTVPSK